MAKPGSAAPLVPMRGPALWSIGCWIVLLLAGFGGVSYLRRADYVSLLCCLVVIVVCAGCILRMRWARQPMRLLAVLLFAWAAVSGGMMIVHWPQFEQARQHAMEQPQLAALMLPIIEQARHSYLVGLALKALLLPLLLWLAWVLGQPKVYDRFRVRSPR